MKRNFEEWMLLVDVACHKIAGCSIHDLGDCCFDDWFEEGISPTSAASRAIKNELGE